ncbi:MAG: PIG-L deacetylase family protein [Aristaeellaceae bacterium]
MKFKGFLLALALVLCASCALAETEAPEITPGCVFAFAPRSTGKGNMTDGSYLTYYSGAYLEVTAPVPCWGLYFSFAQREADIAVQVMDENGAWVTLLTDTRHYTNTYLALPGVDHFRLVPTAGDTLHISEIHLFGEGEPPAWVQDWQPFEGKADLLVLSAHCDDELLFFGGVIPYYAAERGMKVIVCYLTDQTHTRRSEALDGLWTCGVRTYPEMGVFRDIKVNHARECYPYWGQEAVREHIAGLIARYQPEVMVTHDVRGEYGHGAHKVCAEMAMAYVDHQEESAWQVKKLYLHLYQENTLTMDWRQPLMAFGGQTAFDVAAAAFRCHASQRSNGLTVQDSGKYANNLFGLYYSSVGLDSGAADLFEHIP